MKSVVKILTSLAFAAILNLTNCKDKEDPSITPDTRTKTQLITASEWKWTVSTCNVPVDTDGKDGASTNLLIQMPPCEIDNSYTFKSDSTMIEKTNVKCKTNEPVSWKGDWEFLNNEKVLDWDGDDFTIIELSGSKLVLKSSVITGSNTYEITDTYTH